jgi:hypothetical protein
VRGESGRAVVEPETLRRVLIVLATWSAVLGAGVIVALAPSAWATDVRRNLAAATDLTAGRFGEDRGYLYTPLAALLTVAATAIPPAVAIAGWLAARLAIVVAGVRDQTAGWRPVDRFAAGVAAVTFVPTVYDLMLGNVTILIVASVAVVAWSRDRMVAGIAIGLALATIPKPALVPILLWMLVYRRRALVGALVVAAGATVAGLAIVGPGPYLAYLDILRHPDYLDSPQYGNLALTALAPAIALPLGSVTLLGTLIALRRGEVPGLIACLAAGLLLAPYTMAYGPVMLLLSVRPLLAVRPAWTFILAISGSPLVIVFLPIWALAWIGAALLVPRNEWLSRMPTMARQAHRS